MKFILLLITLFNCAITKAQFKMLPKNEISIVKPLFVVKNYTPLLTLNKSLKNRLAMPNNQLMYWPNYPLTPYQFTRRTEIIAENNKPKNALARDIITTIITKKKIVAIKPEF